MRQFGLRPAKLNFSADQFSSFLNDNLACGSLPTEDITPVWDRAKKYNFNSFSVLETPLLFKEQELGRVKRSEKDSTKVKRNPKDIETVTSLISVKDENGNFSEKIMVISADVEYLSKHDIKKNNYKNKDPHFTGEVTYYDKDGTFYLGWKFYDGKILKKIKSVSCNDNAVFSRDYVEVCYLYEQCTDWYVNGVYDGYSCYYFTECTYQYSPQSNQSDAYDPYGYYNTGGGGYSSGDYSDGTTSSTGPSKAFIEASKNATIAYHVNLKCDEYQAAFVKFIIKEGWKYNIQDYQTCKITSKSNQSDLIIDQSYKNGEAISFNRYHVYTIVDGYAFDNNHPDGVPLASYQSNLFCPAGGYPSGFFVDCK